MKNTDNLAVKVNQSAPSSATRSPRQSLTVITPAYNEEAIIEQNIKALADYLSHMPGDYDWEILIINDGSKDRTGELANALAKQYQRVRVHHHSFNKNLGNALQTGFRLSKGDIVTVLDIDLSYAPEHIEQMVGEMETSEADVVVASPYMKGGKSTQVPFLRLMLSKVVNWMMRVIANRDLHTFTGMVRAYKGDFIRQLNLKSSTYAINPEIIQKSFILRKKVVEIPAHLDWSLQRSVGSGRISSLKVFKNILSGLVSSFIFRPYMLFLSIGTILMIVAFYLIGWIFFHTFSVYPSIEVPAEGIENRFSEAVATVFRARPHAFFVGGICLIVALQFLGTSFLSLQSKRYFDELFHLNSKIKEKST